MRILVAALLVAMAFAGCAADPAEPEPAAGPDVITDPTDYSYIDPDQDGSRQHIHDYWRGQDRLDVMAAEATTGSNNCDSCDDQMMVFRFRPDEGQTIPQGAANVSVTISWQDNENSDHEGGQLWVKTAAEVAPSFIADIASGETITIASTNDDNDPPHHILSLWEFWFAVKGRPGDGATFGGSVQMEAIAEKGLEIPPWPPHPDHWQGASELPLLEETRTVSAWTSIRSPMGQTTNCMGPDCLGFHRLAEGAIVPWDTDHVTVTLTYDHATMPALPDLELWFHGADSWQLLAVDPETTDPQEQTYRIPIAPTMGDSPYAKQSLWEFVVLPGGAADQSHFTGAYTLRATAVR